MGTVAPMEGNPPRRLVTKVPSEGAKLRCHGRLFAAVATLVTAPALGPRFPGLSWSATAAFLAQGVPVPAAVHVSIGLPSTGRDPRHWGRASVTTAIANVGDLQGGKSTLVYFDFGGAPVTPGDAITFTQRVEDLGTGGGQLAFNVGNGNCPGVFETHGTIPPLDTVIRNSAAIVTNELNLTTPCTPSDTVMCVDDQPGDRRFEVTATFHSSQGGGSSGNGQEIPLSPLGVNHGGLFWFFGPDNPEMLFKMVNACGFNNHFWVFISAGTNVAFNVTVRDTILGDSVSYSNPDQHAALPVQDTSALHCP
jgi:hypothetical protein